MSVPVTPILRSSLDHSKEYVPIQSVEIKMLESDALNEEIQLRPFTR